MRKKSKFLEKRLTRGRRPYIRCCLLDEFKIEAVRQVTDRGHSEP